MSMTLDGTSGVTFPDNSLQAKSAQGPAFSAYQSVAQSIPNAVLTKLQFQTKEFDLTNAFDSTTSYRFQPNVAGYYQISGALSMSVAVQALLITLYKNGTRLKDGNKGGPAAAYIQTVSLSALIYLNGSTDYVELWGYQSIGAPLNSDGGGSPFTTYFQGILVRAA